MSAGATGRGRGHRHTAAEGQPIKVNHSAMTSPIGLRLFVTIQSESVVTQLIHFPC